MSPSETSHSTSPTLLSRLLRHESEAWRIATKLYGPLVYRWARQAGLEGSDAQDVVQEVYIVLATRLANFQGRGIPGSFRRWLWGVARNKLGDHRRHAAKIPRAAGGSTAYAAAQAIPEMLPPKHGHGDGFDVDASLLHRAVGLLESDFERRTWRAFWRMAVDGRPAAEVAEELGTTKKAVRQAKYRVLQRLRSELDDGPDEL